MNNNINLFYDIRNLFSISNETMDLFYNIKNRILYNRETEFGRTVLLVYITKEIRDREYKKLLVQTDYRRLNNNTITNNYKETFVFSTIKDLKRNDFLLGRRFTDIKFIG